LTTVIGSILTLSGVVFAATLAYIGIKLQIEAPIKATQTAEIKLTQSLSTQTPPTPSALPNETLLYSKILGTIDNNSKEFITFLAEELEPLKNFIAEATFTNPYGANENYWDYGFFLRRSEDSNIRLIVASNDNWRLIYTYSQELADQKYDGNWYENKATGKLDNLRIRKDEKNYLRVIVFEGQACFYVNDQLVSNSSLDFSGVMEPGELGLGVGDYGNQDGTSTIFEDFKVWELDEFHGCE
jgi:hypothetical protein